jgi:hypothetical protein
MEKALRIAEGDWPALPEAMGNGHRIQKYPKKIGRFRQMGRINCGVFGAFPVCGGSRICTS